MNYIYTNFNLLISNRKIILHDVFVQLQSIFNSTNINHGQSYPIFGFWLKYVIRNNSASPRAGAARAILRCHGDSL